MAYHNIFIRVLGPESIYPTHQSSPSLAGFSRPGDLQRPHLSHVPGAAVAARASAAGARSIRDGAGAAAQRGDVQRSGGGDGAVEVEPRRMGLSQPWPNLGQKWGLNHQSWG